MVALKIPEEFSNRQSGACGYIAGLLTEGMAGAVDVMFERKVGAGPGFEVRSDGAGGAWLGRGAVRAVVARPASLRLAVPAMPSLAEARAAARRFDAERHPSPGCFVCGPGRAEGDGLRIVCGPLAHGGVAGTWTPHTAVCDLHGFVRREYGWAALTCPGAWAAMGAGRPDVLWRLTAEQVRPLIGGEEHIVYAWRIGQRGCSTSVGVTVARADGEVCLRSVATWAMVAAADKARAA